MLRETQFQYIGLVISYK